MAERFAPLPYRALELARGDRDRIMVLVHLYTTGHGARWGWWETTQADLIDATGATKTKVSGLLADLVDAGLAETEVLRHGKRSVGTRIRLVDPVAGDALSPTDHRPTIDRPSTDHHEAGPKPASAPPPTIDRPSTDHRPTTYKVGPDPVTYDPVSAAADARAREPVAPEPGPPRPPSEDLELQAAELMALQERDEPQHGMRPPRDLGALRRALQRGTPPERLRALWAWSGVSEDPAIAGCRSGGWRRWSALLKAPRGEERLSLAWAWHEAGRPVAAPARASPARAAPRGGLDALDATWERLGLAPPSDPSPFALPGDPR